MAERTLIYINKLLNSRKMANYLETSLPNSSVLSTNFPLEDIPETDKIVVFGGDGTISTFVSKIIHQQHPAKLVVAGGGTHECFFKSLQQEGAVTSSQDLVQGTGKYRTFYPGILNEHYFITGAELSDFGLKIKSMDEQKLGRLPRKPYRSQLAGALVMLMGQELSDESRLKFLYSSPYLGPFRIFPDMNIFDTQVGLAEFEAKDKKELLYKSLMLLMHLRNHQPPPQHILKTAVGSHFRVERKIILNETFVDGEIKPLKTSPEFAIKRSAKGIPITALI